MRDELHGRPLTAASGPAAFSRFVRYGAGPVEVTEPSNRSPDESRTGCDRRHFTQVSVARAFEISFANRFPLKLR